MTEPTDLEQRFSANLQRVRNLLDPYEDSPAADSGRKPMPIGDLLRAAVVLLNATLEDLLRSLAEWKLPLASPGALDGIPLANGKKASATLVELAE